MDIDWQSHREALEELYLIQDMSLDQVRAAMESQHKFKASKPQYVKQFKVWNLRKNLTKSEWQRIGKAISKRERNGRQTEIRFNGIQIPNSKVKKEVSRHLLPRFESMHSPPPFDKSDMIEIRTPPSIVSMDNDDPSSVKSSILAQKKKKSGISDEIESSKSKIQRTSMNYFSNRAQSYRTCPDTHSLVLQKKTIPYLEFLEFFDSFSSSLSEPLLQGTFFDAPSPSLIPSIPMISHDMMISEYVLDSDYYDVCPGNQAQISKQQTMSFFYKSFANILIPLEGAPSQDQLDANIALQDRLPALLKNMPERTIGEQDSNVALLLGPPSLSAALCLLKTVVYLYSNNLIGDHDSNHGSILRWVIETIPLQNLIAVLRTKLPTILSFRQKLFLYGINTSRISFVKDLIQFDIGLKETMCSSDLALEHAVRSGSAEMVKLVFGFCRSMPFIHTLDKRIDGSEFSVEIAHIFASEGVAIHKLNSYLGRTIFDAAFNRKDLNLIRYLINAGANINEYYEEENWRHIYETHLRIAVLDNQLEIVDLLLQGRADVNAVSYAGVRTFSSAESFFSSPATALQVAAFQGHAAIVSVLLQAKPNVNEPAHGQYGQTALYAATYSGHSHIVELLLRGGANANLPGTSSTKYPRTALSAAVHRNDPTLVRLLLEFGADPNFPVATCYGTTILEAARSQKNAEIISMLLDAGAKNTVQINSALSARHFELMLLHTIRVGDMEKLHKLVGREAQIDLNPIEWDDQFPPVCWDNLKNVTTRRTILHWAIAFKTVDSSMFRYLVKHTINIGKQVNNSDIALTIHEAVRRRKFKFLEILLDAGININARAKSTDTKFAMGDLALHVAIIQHDVEMVSWLLDKNADINLRGYHWSPLQRALGPTDHNPDIVELLLCRGADINAQAEKVHPIYTQSDLKNDSQGYTAFQLAVLRSSSGDPRNLAIIHHFLKLKVNVNEPPAEYGCQSALQIASSFGNRDLVKLLLDHGADINAPISKGDLTALQSAVKGGHIAVVQLLLDSGANVNAFTSSIYGETTLQIAAENGYIKIAQILIASGADVNLSNRLTPLEWATIFGRLDMVQLLINEGADNHLPVEERYVLSLRRARNRNNPGVVALLQKHIDELMDRWDQTNVQEVVDDED